MPLGACPQGHIGRQRKNSEQLKSLLKRCPLNGEAYRTLSNASHSDAGDDDSDDEPSYEEINAWYQSRTAGLHSAIKESNQ